MRARASREILRRGCLISENYKGNGSRGTFVERNRIISGLSKYIIAVESGPTGGTVRQVDYAVSQKRLVYTLYPSANVSSEKITGFNTLISKGARAIKNITDIRKIETYLNN
jgi:DNA processing protein